MTHALVERLWLAHERTQSLIERFEALNDAFLDEIPSKQTVERLVETLSTQINECREALEASILEAHRATRVVREPSRCFNDARRSWHESVLSETTSLLAIIVELGKDKENYAESMSELFDERRYYPRQFAEMQLCVAQEWWESKQRALGRDLDPFRPTVAQLRDSVVVAGYVLRGESDDGTNDHNSVYEQSIDYGNMFAPLRQIALLVEAMGKQHDFPCIGWITEEAIFQWDGRSGDRHGYWGEAEALKDIGERLKIMDYKGLDYPEFSTDSVESTALSALDRIELSAIATTPVPADTVQNGSSADGLPSIVDTIAQRLNQTDIETLRAVADLTLDAGAWPTNADIAKAIPALLGKALNGDNAKQRTGPLFRHGLLDKGPDGQGFRVSDVGQKVLSRVRPEVRPEVATDSD